MTGLLVLGGVQTFLLTGWWVIDRERADPEPSMLTTRFEEVDWVAPELAFDHIAIAGILLRRRCGSGLTHEPH